jgi:DNA-directed RNA polymerase subunit RPC12/RpoP
MSAHTELRCAACGSANLNPKHGKGGNVYTSVCEDCGHRDDYVWPEEDE